MDRHIEISKTGPQTQTPRNSCRTWKAFQRSKVVIDKRKKRNRVGIWGTTIAIWTLKCQESNKKQSRNFGTRNKARNSREFMDHITTLIPRGQVDRRVASLLQDVQRLITCASAPQSQKGASSGSERSGVNSRASRGVGGGVRPADGR
jgi:hypothetical protein